MRQNRMKKCLTTVLSGILVLSLSGCGQTAKLPEEVVNTSLVVEKDGKVISYLVNTFDKEFYSSRRTGRDGEERGRRVQCRTCGYTGRSADCEDSAGFRRRSHGAGRAGVRPTRTAMPSTTNRTCSTGPGWKRWHREVTVNQGAGERSGRHSGGSGQAGQGAGKGII